MYIEEAKVIAALDSVMDILPVPLAIEVERAVIYFLVDLENGNKTNLASVLEVVEPYPVLKRAILVMVSQIAA